MMKWSCFLLFSFLSLLSVNGRRYSNYWIVRITDETRVDTIATSTGLINHGKVGHLDDVFQFEFKEGIGNTHYDNITSLLKSFPEVNEVEQERTLNHAVRNFTLPTDPDWKYQWPWYNTGQFGGPVGNDLNVVPIWIEGVSGKGTKALVIDNGIQLNHPDLQPNIDRSLCYSAIRGGSMDITPISSLPDYNHGTSCAGEIAMVHDNGVCGTGVAYDTTVGGFQVNFSDFLPNVEITAFNHLYQQIDVYSNSWGPSDDGYTIQQPSFATQSALSKGVNDGRNGRGSIYVFSSGNGGQNDDSCAADGYASSIYTIAVGSVDQAGRQAFYDEDCSGKLAVTYSYNSHDTSDQVVTAYPNSECARNFTGTSASAPLVTGAILLALEVNPNLSWRDVQYLIVYTSKSSSLVDGEFTTNGAGLRVSGKFGFGAIDVQSLVTRARYWTPVPDPVPRSFTILGGQGGFSVAVTQSNSYSTTFNVPSQQNRMYLEHVILTATFGISSSSDGTCYSEESVLSNPFVINHTGSRRGDVSLQLCSPSGTCSTLLPERHRDYVNCVGYTNWPFMSVHFWGEDPVGTWQIKMSFSSSTGSAQLSSLSVQFIGINQKPINVVDKCDSACATPTGCSYGNGSQYCDSCSSGYYRNVTTLQCVRSCTPGACIIEGACVFYNGTCPVIPSSPHTLSQTDIIYIVSGGIGLIGIIIILVSLVCCCVCCCCCGSSKGREGTRRYQRLSFHDGPDVIPYMSYKEPSIV